ncbi:serine/threonine-protein kinase-like protein At3g51990 [Magnolia sinica]|uniref:serine/threonine-protein kinase-like protein At3g51990 n=1 Tax=Magnolia sinica TaxID=86752 RepID=UPI00265A1021|nr:serine/threonine-protein kinase-like protein At3g51990 [Magnolia sinica]
MKYFACKSECAIATSNSKKKKKAKATEYKYECSAEYRLFSYDELESATNGFSPESFLGKGSHGSVYKAFIDGGKLVVAVKKMRILLAEENSSGSSSKNNNNNNNNNDENNPIENELEILSRIRNPGFVNLLGYSIDSNERKLIVVEFMANGALHEHLHCDRRQLGWGRRVRFALQTAKAVEALHLLDPPVIHRDIKSSNVLVDENWNARLGDFGLALRGHVEDVRMRSTPPAGTMGYLDPGYVTPENLSTKSDVFSFGILLLEILSGRNAIDMNYSPPSVVDWAVPLIKQGRWDLLYDPRIEPPKDQFVRWQLAVLAARCVRAAAEKRPSMNEVVNCLRIVRKRICSPIWNNLTNRMTKLNSKFEPSEVISMSLKNASGNSNLFRNRKVLNVKSGVGLAKETRSTIVDCISCKDTVGLVSEPKAESNSKTSNPNAANSKTGLVVRMPRVRLNKPKSIGISKAGRVLHVSAGKDPAL